MDRTTLEIDVLRLGLDLDVATLMLEALIAKEDWGLAPGKLVTDSQGREGRVTLITFPNGRQARPFVWMQRRLAGGKWQARSRLLGEAWSLASEKSDGEATESVA